MRADQRFGYFPPGEKPNGNQAHGGADPFSYFPNPNTPAEAPVSGAEAFQGVEAGVCPFCGADFRDKRSPAASLSGHIRAKIKDGKHHL